MKTTIFKQYSHYKWIVINSDRKYGVIYNPGNTVFYWRVMLKYWFNDLIRFIKGKRWKRDKLGNSIN